MTTNIFVLGLTERQHRELRTVAHADDYEFHGLLSADLLTREPTEDFHVLADRARAELAAFGGSVDAIIAHWDFPTSVLGPLLAHENGIPSPSLRSVIACEHKYWSRLLQHEAAPECVPRFTAFDPFADHPSDGIDLSYPFWVKPVKSHSSKLGFKVSEDAEFQRAIEELRAGVQDVGDSFDQAMELVEVPAAVADVEGTWCIAEEFVEGTQAAPEGSMVGGQFVLHGLVDMHRSENGRSFDRLDYPAASVPDRVQHRMVEVSERLVRQAGFDDGCFNVEFIWNEDTDRLTVVEVNTRISQSHSELFARVDGASNHEYAIDVALGRSPTPGRREGDQAVAAKCVIGVDADGVVQAVPTDEDVARLRAEVGDCVVEYDVSPGDRLADLPNQDPYRYVVATVYLGASDVDELRGRFDRARQLLPFDIAAAPGASSPV